MDASTNINAFKKSLTFTLKWEGGYVNDADDPGGETKWGISKRAYPEVDIKNLTPELASELYFRDYWVRSGCQELSFPFNTAVFDTAVNCGVGRATGWLKNTTDPGTYLELRKQHYIQLVNKNDRMFKFFKGWMRRLTDLKKFVEVNAV